MSFAIAFVFDDLDIRVECNSFATVVNIRGDDSEWSAAPKWIHEEMRSLHHALNGGQLMLRVREELREIRGKAGV